MLKKKDHFIVGTGFIANKFKKYLKFIQKNKITIYAAGISNSLDVNKKNLNNELLRFTKFVNLN